MDGILVINKPAGYTSHDCIAILRGICGIKKLGHTGTLDPNATGVLPVCAGKATKLIEYMDKASKTYVAGVRFGLITDTQDIWGKEDAGLMPAGQRKPVPSGASQIEEALRSFEGEIDQVPPAFSAVFVNGQRAYSMARNGEKPALSARKVMVYSIKLLEYSPEKAEALIEVCCGRGTYVRTICHDLGMKLGCGACLSSLVRTRACGFDISEALDLEEARTMERDAVLARLLPIGRAIGDMPRLELDKEASVRYLNGMTIKTDPSGYPQQQPIAVFYNEELIGVSEFIRDSLKPLKVFS